MKIDFLIYHVFFKTLVCCGLDLNQNGCSLDTIRTLSFFTGSIRIVTAVFSRVQICWDFYDNQISIQQLLSYR